MLQQNKPKQEEPKKQEGSEPQEVPEGMRRLKNPLSESRMRDLDSPSAELARYIIETITGKKSDPIIRTPGKDIIVTEDEYRKLILTPKSVMVTVAQEKEIKSFLKQNESHEDKTKIKPEDLTKVLNLIGLHKPYEVVEYINTTSDVPKYRTQILSLVEPYTGENIIITLGGPTDIFSVHKNYSFRLFKGVEKDLVNVILGQKDQKGNIVSSIPEDTKFIFTKAKDKKIHDKLDLILPDNNKKVTLLFEKGTTLLVGVEKEKEKDPENIKNLKMPEVKRE